MLLIIHFLFLVLVLLFSCLFFLSCCSQTLLGTIVISVAVVAVISVAVVVVVAAWVLLSLS